MWNLKTIPNKAVNTASNYLLKVNNRNIRTRCEYVHRCEIFSNCELWTYFTPCSSAFIFNFEQINAGYGCSFVAKLSRKKMSFFWKNICVLYKICITCRKNVFIWKKSFTLKNFFAEKTFFHREKYKWKCKKYISHLNNTFLYWKCLRYKI